MNNIKIIMSKRPNGLPDETNFEIVTTQSNALKDCLLYTSDAADE